MKTINSLRSKLLALTLALMASVSTFAYDYHGDLLCYNILTDSTVAVTGQSEYKTMPRYEYLPENLVIPSEVTLQGKTYKVVSIDQWAFYACTMLKSVTIPSSVTFIGLSAFQYCENLVNVDIPTSVTTVEGSAFSYTKWYDNLPDGEVYINNTLYRYKGTAPENTQIVVKDGTTRIAGFTFWNQSNIVAIELPQTLTDIEHGAFEGCTQLSSILIPKNVTFIGASAFAECTGLKEVICLAPTPPIAGVDANPSPSDWMFAGVDVANVLLYVPMESIELYRNADQWKDFQIRVYYGSEECNEYKHVKLSVISYGNKLIYSLVTDDGSEIPDVDSVWILNTDKEPLQKFYGQSRDTIDLLFLELGTYILEVYLNECVKRKIFFVHPKMKYIWCDTWNIMWFDGWRFDETASTSQYRLGKDTIIGDYTYSKFTSRTSVRFTSDRKVYVYYEGFDDNDPYTQDLLTGEYLAYDFSAQVGDTLEIFSGIHSYTTEQCVVYDVQTDPETNLRTIMLHPLRVVDGDGNVGVSGEEITWLEGVGSPNGFLISTPPPGGGTYSLLCAYQGDELKYTGSLYDEYGCEYNATEQNPEDLFPTLWGLQRTSCDEWFDGCEENKSYLFAPKEITEINGKQYLKCGGVFLREEDSKVLIYSFPYEKDLVLYDYTLEVGDTLQNLGIDIYSFPELEYAAVVDYIAYEDYDVETDEFIIKKEPLGSKRVTEVSTITLLDGKEYKRWLFGNDWENGNYYVEGIGNVGGSFGGDYINIANPYALPTCYMGEHLVCVSKNNKLLYQMDPVKMDELGAECLCDYDRGPRKDNAKDGQIGGRPTPTQWNQLEVVLRQMDNNHTILQAETFSYTLEDISQQVNNKTYFQLARQSTKDTATTKSVVGALHFGKDEDNRVYFLRDGVEYVLYDFTAEIGDTVEIFAGINNYPQETTYTHVVVDKDTTEDGACRMFLEVVFPDETNATAENAEKVWLAGLGSVDGIVHNAAKRTSNAHAAPSRSASSETESSVMLCAWREDSCLYTTNHPDYDTFGCVYNQDPTAVEDISTSQSSYQKLLRDGQLFIIHDGKTYNVLGVLVE